MPPLMHLALTNAVCAALLAVLALAVGRCFRRPALTHGLWLLVLVKLITPPLFPLSLAWLPAGEAPPAVVVEEEAPVAAFAYLDWQPETVGPPMPADVWNEMEKAQGKTTIQVQALVAARPWWKSEPDMIVQTPPSATPGPVPVYRAAPRVAPAGDSRVESLWVFLGGIWAIGSVVWFARSVWRLARFQRPAPACSTGPGTCAGMALGWPVSWDCGAAPRSCCCRRLCRRWSGPPSAGRACCCLPVCWIGSTTSNGRLCWPMNLHTSAGETTGCARLEFLVLGLFWWYPLAWWARARLQAAEEECCDAWVVEEVPARSYASAIVETVDFLADDLTAVPALASGLGRVHALKRRLTLIFSGSAPKRLNVAGRLAVLTLALVLLPLVPILAQSEKKTDDAAPEQPAETPRLADPSEESIIFRTNRLQLTGGDHQAAALAVSPDGRYLAAGTGYVDRPGEVRVWTIPEHKEVLIYGTARGSRRWPSLPTADTWPRLASMVRPWSVNFHPARSSASCHWTEQHAWPSAPDGKTLITVTEAKTIKVWDPLSGAEVARLEDRSVSWYCVAASRDGKYLATGGGEINQNEAVGQVTLWDAASHKSLGKVQLAKGHSVMSVAFTPDGRTLAAGSTDGTVALWQVAGLKPIGTLEKHDDWVKAMTFTPDGKTLITASHDGTVRLWDLAKQMPITPPGRAHPSHSLCRCFSRRQDGVQRRGRTDDQGLEPGHAQGDSQLSAVARTGRRGFPHPGDGLFPRWPAAGHRT